MYSEEIFFYIYLFLGSMGITVYKFTTYQRYYFLLDVQKITVKQLRQRRVWEKKGGGLNKNL